LAGRKHFKLESYSSYLKISFFDLFKTASLTQIHSTGLVQLDSNGSRSSITYHQARSLAAESLQAGVVPDTIFDEQMSRKNQGICPLSTQLCRRRILVATYVITQSPNVNWDNTTYKYRYRSNNGEPTAQVEFDRRISGDESAFLWRWENHTPKLIQSSQERRR
jgi:hypothetical protein